jgi:O-antigen/teichoic acid export membrane protein
MSTESTMARSARGTGFLALQSVVSVLIGTLLYIYQTRVLTKEEMGVYAAVLLVQNIATVIGVLGFDAAASRFIPYLSSKGDTRGLKSFSRRILILALASASVFGIAYFLLSPIFSALMLGSNSYASVFQLDSLVVLLGILATVLSGYIQGLQKYLRLATYRLISQIIRIGSSIALLGGGFGVVSIYYGWASYNALLVILSLPVAFILLSAKVSDQSAGETQNTSTKSLLAFSTPIMIYGALAYLSGSIDQLFVLSAGAEALGAYSVAVTGATLISQIFSGPLLQTTTSGMSEIHGRSHPEELQKFLNTATRFVGMLFLPLIMGLAALAPLAIFVLAGASYPESALPFSIICLGMSVLGFSVIIQSTLVALGETRKIMLAFLGAVMVQFAVGYTLTPVLGLIGASLSKIAMYIVMFLLFLKLGGDSASMKFGRRFLLGTVSSSLAMGLIVYFAASFTGFKLIFLPLYVILGLAVYGLGLSAMRIIRTSDITLFLSVVPLGDRIHRAAKKTLLKHRFLERLLKRLVVSKE